MVAILEKGEQNVNFHPIVDFIEASPLRYALTVKPTVYVSHIQQFWSIARIETTEDGTKILATVDDIVRTVSESSLRKNLKLRDEEGISSLPDAKLFENLTLMGYNISQNQKFTFQKVPFHTRKLFTTLWVNNPSFSGRIVPLFDIMLVHQGEGSGTPTVSHHTPSSEALSPLHTTHTSPSIPPLTTTSIPTVTPTETTPIRQYTRRARIAQSSALPTVPDEPASPQRDDSQWEACPTDSGFVADQDRATIAKSSTLSHNLAPRVTSPAAIEGSMQQTIPELTALCTSLQRHLSELTDKFQAQEVEINRLKARVKLLEERERIASKSSGDDAPIKGRSMDEGEAAIERVSDDTKEMATVLTSMDAATVLASVVVDVPTGSGSIPTASIIAEGLVPTGSEEVPTASLVFTTATVVTPVTRRKEQLEREDQRRAEQTARDTKVARIHVEEELRKLPIERRVEQISDLVKYQDNYTKIYKFQSQQRKPWTKKQKRDYYMDVIRNNLGWKVKDFRGMTFEEVEAKFNLVWMQMEDFIPMGLKEEAKKIKRKGLNLEQESAKKQKTLEEVPEEAMSPEEVTEEKRSYWKITRLGGSSASYQFFIDLLKHLDREDLNQLWRLVKETLSKRPPTSEKEMELWIIIVFWKLDCSWSIKFRGGLLGIKCTRHSHCQLQSSYWQNNFPLPVKKDATARIKAILGEYLTTKAIWKWLQSMNKKIIAKKESSNKKTAPKTNKLVKLAPAKQAKPATAKQPKPEPVKEKSTKPTSLQKAGKVKVSKVLNVKSSLQLVDEPDEEQAQPEPVHEPQGAGEEYDVERAIQMNLHTPKRRSTTDQYVLQRWILATEEASTRPSTLPQDDISEKIIQDTSSLADSMNVPQKGQIRPYKTPDSRPPPVDDKMDEDQAGSNPIKSHVALAGSNLEPMHDDFVATVYLKVHESLKLLADEQVILEDPLSLSGTLSSMKNLDDTYTFRDQELPEADMKKILHQRMFESGSYKSVLEHVALYEALEASIERANIDEFLAKKDKSRKRRHDDQDPRPPPPDSDLSTKKRYDSDTSGSKQHLDPQSSAWKTSYTREAPSSSSKQQSAPHFEQPIKDVPILDDMNISNSKDIDTTHLPKIKIRHDWIGKKKLSKSNLEGPSFKVVKAFYENSISLKFHMEECHRLLTDQVDLVNPKGHRLVPNVSKPLPLGGTPGQSTILLNGGLRKRNSTSLDTAPPLIVMQADYNEYKISEADFKNLHPDDFEDLYVLHL
nr:hypothetical protein [Tanacetum cinerariifolium]